MEVMDPVRTAVVPHEGGTHTLQAVAAFYDNVEAFRILLGKNLHLGSYPWLLQHTAARHSELTEAAGSGQLAALEELRAC